MRLEALTSRPMTKDQFPNTDASADPALEQWWRAVAARDARWDGRFLYGVRTTGVFCRPSCPSRRPRRENVEFFERVETAVAAGFRACRRCNPEGPRPRTIDDRIEAARALIEARPDEVVTLSQLASRLGVSPFHLQRRFTERFGMSPSAYGRAVRMRRFKSALRSGTPVAAATYEAGFGSSRAAYEDAARAMGMSPAAYRAGGRGEEVRYAVAECPLGRVLIAETDRGVCAVHFGTRGPELEEMLEAEFPAAARARVDLGALRHGAEVLAAIAGEARSRVPLDIRGTPFQRQVWEALQAIPPGETRAYADVARAIGRPDATRAVASACAANRVAVLVPCHRVVTRSGAAGGYRWGVPRKRALLLRERVGRG